MAARASHEHPPFARLRYTPPFDWDFFLIFHRARALPGVEQVDGDCYRRTVRCGEYVGRLRLLPSADDALALSITPHDDDALAALVARVRRAFDLDEIGRAHV